jgi:hypothetical protein
MITAAPCVMVVLKKLGTLILLLPFSSWCWSFLPIVWNLQLHLFDRIVEARQIFGKKFFREILIMACWAI